MNALCHITSNILNNLQNNLQNSLQKNLQNNLQNNLNNSQNYRFYDAFSHLGHSSLWILLVKDGCSWNKDFCADSLMIPLLDLLDNGSKPNVQVQLSDSAD